MEALVHLRPAMVADLIDGGQLVPNRVYFEKSVTTGKLEGPYVTMEQDTFIRQMYYKIQIRMVYLPCIYAAPDELPCTMVFRLAKPEDLKDGEYLRYNFTYYILANNVLNGPFTITKKTIVKDMKVQLQQSLIYIIDHKSTQHFKEINGSHEKAE